MNIRSEIRRWYLINFKYISANTVLGFEKQNIGVILNDCQWF